MVSTASVVIFLLAYLLLPFVLMVRAFRFPGEADVRRWAGAYGVVLNEANRPHIVEYLRRSRRFRATGGCLCWLLSGLPVLLERLAPYGTGSLLLAGYFGGAALAEATLAWPRPEEGRRRALLTPRRVGDYLASWVRPVLWSAAVLVPLLAVLYALVLDGRAPPEGRATVGELWRGAAVVVVVALVSELAQRLVVARAQPASSPDLVAADDACRAASVSTAAGAGLGIALAGLASMTSALAYLTDVRLVRWSLLVACIPVIVLSLAALFSVIFKGYSPEPWFFGRRPVASSQPG